MPNLETIDIGPFLSSKNSEKAIESCYKTAEILMETSCLIIRDPRVTEQDNSNFLDMMERYFEQPLEEKMKDVHPELSYQLGATPEFTELPRDHSDQIEAYSSSEENKPHKPKGPDPKWRFFWRMGPRPKNTKFPELNAEPVIPAHFPEWEEVMNKWGSLMLQAVHTVSEMLSIGLGLPPSTFLDYLENGPHLLAPTGSDLARFGTLNTVFAGFHYDLNFLTIHGRSRFPGLYIWLREGSRMQVRVPDGCLLLQAGRQLEWLTGGKITAGFHEVVFSEQTLMAVRKVQSENAQEKANEHLATKDSKRRSLWRVSSTLFAHVASDKILEPLEPFASPKLNAEKYPPTLAGVQVQEELDQIKLGGNTGIQKL